MTARMSGASVHLRDTAPATSTTSGCRVFNRTEALCSGTVDRVLVITQGGNDRVAPAADTSAVGAGG